MTDLIVEAGRTYLDGFGEYHRMELREKCAPFALSYPYQDQKGQIYDAAGKSIVSREASRHLVALVPKQETSPMTDSIDHLFKVVPATRKFVGGEVKGVRLSNGGEAGGRKHLRMGLVNGGYTYLLLPEARLLAAALIAAADAIEGEAK